MIELSGGNYYDDDFRLRNKEGELLNCFGETSIEARIRYARYKRRRNDETLSLLALLDLIDHEIHGAV